MINERIRVQASKLFARGNPCATCDCKAKCRTKTCPCRRASIACSTKCHAKIVPHIHRDYVHPDELFRLEELLTIINSHTDRYSKHELLEDSTIPNASPITPPEQEQNISSTLVFCHDQSFYD